MPDSPRLHNNLAAAYATMGEHKQAIETLRAAVQAHPDVPYLRERLTALGLLASILSPTAVRERHAHHTTIRNTTQQN